ncbi:MAG: glycine dehydrogenase, partial [Opitutae bacterium]|nr:glycine dehydrogenase [Opitutae bacterium]
MSSPTSSTLPKNECIVQLPYDPEEHPREKSRHYISATGEDIASMLETVKLNHLPELFSHLPQEQLFKGNLDLPEELSYEVAADHLLRVSQKTKLHTSFIGDLLPVWKVHPIVGQVSQLRPLSTSYTPYQPERSQGTLVTHWIYQCVLSNLTGFEAINTSLYDRSAAIFEAICCARRSRKRPGSVLLAQSLFEEDISFLRTHARGTDLDFEIGPLDTTTGKLDYDKIKVLVDEKHSAISAIVFP